MNNTDLINIERPLIFTLGVTILCLLAKGIQYAIIGSYLPVILGLLCLGMLYYGWHTSPKAFRRTIRIWAIILITWSMIRIMIQVVFYFTPTMTESHIREQFTLIQNILTIIVLVAGVYLIRLAKTIK